MVCHDTRSPNAASASRSAVCQAPLMNCTTPTRWPRPSMRNASPNAAVDLPLPAPVWTMRSPFSIVFSATSASCTALRFAILARWRSASASSALVIDVTARSCHCPVAGLGPADGHGTRPRSQVLDTPDDRMGDFTGAESGPTGTVGSVCCSDSAKERCPETIVLPELVDRTGAAIVCSLSGSRPRRSPTTKHWSRRAIVCGRTHRERIGEAPERGSVMARNSLGA